MKLNEIIDKLKLEVRGRTGAKDVEVSGGYASDLLSDVLANCAENNLWITLQIHPNIVAVASMKGVAAIVLINSREPTEETVARADDENIPILVTPLPSFELIGRLYAMGIRGMADSADGA